MALATGTEQLALRQKVENAIVQRDPEGRVTCRALRLVYEKWCEEMGHAALGGRKLAQRLRRHAVTSTTRRVDGKVLDAWAGVRLLSEYETPSLV